MVRSDVRRRSGRPWCCHLQPARATPRPQRQSVHSPRRAGREGGPARVSRLPSSGRTSSTEQSLRHRPSSSPHTPGPPSARSSTRRRDGRECRGSQGGPSPAGPAQSRSECPASTGCEGPRCSCPRGGVSMAGHSAGSEVQGRESSLSDRADTGRTPGTGHWAMGQCLRLGINQKYNYKVLDLNFSNIYYNDAFPQHY